VRMHTNKFLEAAQVAAKWAQLALLLIFIAFQEREAGRRDKASEIIGEICKSKARLG
jgi:16S rRNA C1402 N4-methylase RsmH